MEERLSIHQLSLRLEQKLLLNDINLNLELGQSYSFIGESGAGKTLLTKLMVGQVPDNAQLTGTIHYKTKNLQQLTPKEWQHLHGKELAYMMQNPMAMFNPFQKIKIHFIETMQSHFSYSKEQCLQKARLVMREVRLGHIDQLLESYPFELSGGMLQRIMLAILLCLDSHTIILDEPTSSLDAYNRDNILTILKRLQEQGKTIITVTHDYDLAKSLGGTIFVLYQGEIVEQGNVEEILENPKHPYTRELILGNPYERLVRNDD
ncbi:ATP-binding cassette domain-containing protein [Streptococcus merionis]|uniref:ATP-binding cassette domain-containing protein n=1 Tax=Streptococcus merionis TaxID=400065 RepID=UPI0026E9828E|nr:ATP-binding cassette domain-containing protein [Streptococcus merionis]